MPPTRRTKRTPTQRTASALVCRPTFWRLNSVAKLEEAIVSAPARIRRKTKTRNSGPPAARRSRSRGEDDARRPETVAGDRSSVTADTCSLRSHWAARTP